MNCYLKLQDGGISTENINLDVKKNNGIKAVFVDAAIPPVEFPYGNFNYLNLDCAVIIEIDKPCHMKGYMANYLYSEYWCRPFFGTDTGKIPPDTQTLIWEKKDGTFGIILPVCSEKYKCTLEGGQNGITAKMYSWCYGLNECKALAFLYAEGDNPFELIEKCVNYGLDLLGDFSKPRTNREYPEIFNYLGWCSWDALQIRVSEEGLLEKCEEFKEKSIPVRWAIIDDMWSDVKGLNEAEYETFGEMCDIMHASKLYSFEADHKRFPDGLKCCIDKIKDYDMKVGIWYPTTGYWKGIDPDGDVAEKYKDMLIKTGDGRYVHSHEFKKAYGFYNAHNTYLKDCGADFVKIDNQSFIRGYLKGFAPVGEVARNLHKAIEKSVDENFDNQLINCAGMAQENMWNRSTSTISRCSDDFLPENREWFTKHILQCSYNSLVQGQFLWCDWDMWWTDDGQAIKNSVLRAISGGPVYVSDKIGRSKKEILEPLMLSDGKILRCDRPAMPTMDCIVIDPENVDKPFKVWNKCDNNGIIAAFNLNKNNKAVKGNFSVSDIVGLMGKEFAVFEHFSRNTKIINKNETLEFNLENQDDFKLFIIVPIQNGFAPIGLIEKYNSTKAINSVNGTKIELAEGGLFAFVSEKEIEHIMVNECECIFNKKNNLYTVDSSNINGKVVISIL